jgi:hypothetical protein
MSSAAAVSDLTVIAFKFGASALLEASGATPR